MYYYLKSPSFEISMKIKAAKNSEFFQLSPIHEVLHNNKKNIHEIILDKFVKDIFNDEKNKKNFKTLYELDTKNKLIISDKVKGKNYDYLFKLDWNQKDIEFGKEILTNIVEESLLFFNKSYFEDLALDLTNKKNSFKKKDLEKILVFKDHYNLALKLGYSSKDLVRNLDSLYFIFNNSIVPDTSFPYYLLGHEAILEMINIVQNQEYENINNLLKIVDDLRKNNNFNWIEYNPSTIEVKNKETNNYKTIIILSILIGLMIGLLQILFSHAKISR